MPNRKVPLQVPYHLWGHFNLKGRKNMATTNGVYSRQQQRILDYIADFGSITAGEAHIDLGILNFSARLSELKDKGIRFKSKRETARNRYQEPISYYRYSFYEEETK